MTEHKDAPELLPCPFCGSPGAICVLEDEPGSPISFWVSCHCGVETKERRTEEEAVALWNTRAARPQAAEPVGWRWRYRNFPGEMGWIVVSTEPKRHDDVEVQPLYAAPPSQTAAVRENCGDDCYHAPTGICLPGKCQRAALTDAGDRK